MAQKKTTKTTRKNASPQIMGKWVDRPSPGTTDDPFSHPSLREAVQADPSLRSKVAVLRAESDARRKEEAAEQLAYAERFAQQHPELVKELSLEPPTARRKGAPDPQVNPVLQQLVADGAEMPDIAALLDAVVSILNLTFDASLGYTGSLFNFEHRAVKQVIEAAGELRRQRKRAEEILAQQKMLEELAAIYQATADAWARKAVMNGSRDSNLTRAEKALMKAQEEALLVCFERHRIPTARVSEARRHGAEIRTALGSVKVAAEVLDDLGYGSDSKLTHGRGGVSPLYERRLQQVPFPVDGPPAVSDLFGAFAAAIFDVAKRPTSLSYDDANAQKEALAGQRRHELVSAFATEQARARTLPPREEDRDDIVHLFDGSEGRPLDRVDQQETPTSSVDAGITTDSVPSRHPR